ncbi:MAG: hypothetical protein MI684_08600 [Chlorobiales bacterium]|nr:hypothetical protein [Chlorobiales bacterium]
MTLQARKTASPPSIWTWLSITSLWGTIFFATSVLTLSVAASWLEQGFFNPAWSEIYSVYAIYFFVLLFFAVSAMLVKNKMDPRGEKQTMRQQEVAAGKREMVFVSLAGSIATSFFFTVMTALVFFAASISLVDMTIDFTLPVVLVASVLNIAAGLSASLLVGLVLFVLKKV